jgi:hypothetical protein
MKASRSKSFHFPKPLFTQSELWIHGLTIPILFPVGNYLFLDSRYFTDPAVFGWGTLQTCFLYSLSVVILTIVVKIIFQWYPDVAQVRKRYITALLAVSTITAGSTVLATWMYSLSPVFRRPFSWETVNGALWLGATFDILLCLVLTIQYTYGRWQENQTEKEQLKRAVLQQDFERLKHQINPHFLFNSLTSLSVLIGQDQKQASSFVDHLAMVYRYILSAPAHSMTTLEAELNFIKSYSHLLKTRYQSGISIQFNVDPHWYPANLPPQSLQMLLDHATRHNIISAKKPLIIHISSLPASGLLVQYNRQPKMNRFGPESDTLTALLAKYASMPIPAVVMNEDASCFTIILPLLMEEKYFSA